MQYNQKDISYYVDMLEYKFELDDFQKDSFNHIINNDNVLVTAHTGSGKTVIAELAILKNLLCGKKIIYTSPIKSLSNEKYKDFKNKFEKNNKFNFIEKNKVGLLTGDLKINPDANILIMTTEILRIILYSTNSQNKYISNDVDLNNIGCVIFDEVHYINNAQRGTIWEETIMLLQKNIQLIMLSATIQNAHFFAEWITNIKSKKTHLMSTNKRIVPLKNYIYVDNSLFLIMDENDKYIDDNVDIACRTFYEYKKTIKKHISYVDTIQKIVNFVMKNNLYPCTFFSFSRYNCEKLATSLNTSLVDDIEKSQIDSIFKYYMHTYNDIFLKIKNYQIIYNLLIKGIAFHHSGMLPILKEIVEIIFEKGFIKILFATETFAVGINKPIRTVIFLELEKFTDSKKRFLQTDEYKQMMGRAGRRGLDKEGTIIIIPNMNDDFFEKKTLKDLLQGNLPEIKSKLTINCSFILKLLYYEQYNEKYNEYVNNNDSYVNQSFQPTIKEFIKMSLSQKENNVNIIQVLFEKNICEKKINELVIDNIKLNQYKNFIEKQKILNNVNISISSKQKKEFLKNKQKFENTSTYDIYIQEENRLSELNNIIFNSSDYNNNIYDILSFLNKINYLQFKLSIAEFNRTGTNVYSNTCFEENITGEDVSKDTSENNKKSDNESFIDIISPEYNCLLTINGIIAAHINDCNCFILTEMFTRKIFHNLSSAHIVGLLAIFIDNKQEYHLSDVENVVIKKCIKDITSIIDKFNVVEHEMHFYNNDWTIYYNFIDIAYCWADNGNYFDICKKGNIYEGNFVKNILKINNIVDNLIKICHIYNDVSILNILQQINPLIIKDIVLNVSLYV